MSSSHDAGVTSWLHRHSHVVVTPLPSSLVPHRQPARARPRRQDRPPPAAAENLLPQALVAPKTLGAGDRIPERAVDTEPLRADYRRAGDGACHHRDAGARNTDGQRVWVSTANEAGVPAAVTTSQQRVEAAADDRRPGRRRQRYSRGGHRPRRGRRHQRMRVEPAEQLRRRTAAEFKRVDKATVREETWRRWTSEQSHACRLAAVVSQSVSRSTLSSAPGRILPSEWRTSAF